MNSRFRDAFKETFNILGLATTAAVSAALLNPLPLLGALVAEAAYLLFVPDSKWYERRLSRRHDAEVERRRQDLMRKTFPLLRPELQERFQRLLKARRELEGLPRSDEKWYREVLRKLDYLAEKFLLFAAREAEFRTYLRSIREEARGEKGKGKEKGRSKGYREFREEADDRRQSMEEQILGLFFPGLMNVEFEGEDDARDKRDRRRREKQWPPPKQEAETPPAQGDPWIQESVTEIQSKYDREKQGIEAALAGEQDFDTKAVLEKRIEVLQRRHDFVGKIGKILTNLDHQLELLEDTFGLISDEIRAHPPEQVLADIDDVVWQADTMTKVLEQIAPYESGATSLQMGME